MNLSNLKIGARLGLGFGAVVALLIVLVTVAYINFTRLGKANDLNIHTHEVINEVQDIRTSLISIQSSQRGFALTGNDASLELYKTGKEAFKQHWEKAKALTSVNPAQQERLDRLAQQQQQWLQERIDPMIKLRRETTNDNIATLIAAAQPGQSKVTMDSMLALLAEISKTEAALLEQRDKDATALESLTGSTLIGGGITATVLAAVLAFWLTRNITRPLQEAVTVAKQVALGDLSMQVRVKSKDETGELLQALKDMNESLVRIVTEVRTGTETISTASTQIAAGNQDLSSRTEQQASSLEETASSMEELTSTVKQNADNARQANTLAASASEVAQKGGDVVSQVVSTMGSINESAKKIVDIIGVIDGIAFQTNILALNAAVEAARAGEQGRGFAVVASEVRSLAQRSANAAKEIKTLISDSVEKVEAGSKLVDQAGTTMDEVVASVRRVSDIIGEIAAASDEQRTGIEQVNLAIAQMDQVTQQNAALVEEAAAAADSMNQQAGNLSQVVSVFKLDASASALVAAAPAASLAPVVSVKPAVSAKPAAKLATGVPARTPERKTALASHRAPAGERPSRTPVNTERAKPAGDDPGDWEEF